uniref:Uncharacterized protein n=1 Tax=Mycena chlorophos TaxID=658473 RepID=A0ABQ0M2S4_MYCCL|nr:predicted protein [Mycena chlorophos]
MVRARIHTYDLLLKASLSECTTYIEQPVAAHGSLRPSQNTFLARMSPPLVTADSAPECPQERAQAVPNLQILVVAPKRTNHRRADSKAARCPTRGEEAKRLRRERDSAMPRAEGKEVCFQWFTGILDPRDTTLGSSLRSPFCPLPRDSARPTLRQLIDANADLQAELDVRKDERDCALLRVEELELLRDTATVLSTEVEQLKDEKERFCGEWEHAQHQLRAAEEQTALLTQANAAL